MTKARIFSALVAAAGAGAAVSLTAEAGPNDVPFTEALPEQAVTNGQRGWLVSWVPSVFPGAAISDAQRLQCHKMRDGRHRCSLLESAERTPAQFVALERQGEAPEISGCTPEGNPQFERLRRAKLTAPQEAGLADLLLQFGIKIEEAHTFTVYRSGAGLRWKAEVYRVDSEAAYVAKKCNGDPVQQVR